MPRLITLPWLYPALLCLFLIGSACDSVPGHPSTVLSSGTSLLSPPSQPAKTIVIGEVIEDTLTFNGDKKAFTVVAPSDGTLVATVTWNPNDGRVELWLDGRGFQAPSPLVEAVPAAAGQTYRVMVADSAAWDYGGLFLPFGLTTSMSN
jgi:hypothetical protein